MSALLDELQSVPVNRIKPWKGNPRKTFDQAKLEELAQSIREQGVLQPLLLRPVRSSVASNQAEQQVAEALGIAGETHYEIVAGERRWRAAKLAGLTVVPATVRKLSDKDMLEVAVVENEQREGVSALERAEGYARLVEGYKMKVEDLAARVGKSPSTIRAALRMRHLPDNARKALQEGKLVPAVAELIASRPSPAMRDDVARFALQARPSFDDLDKGKEYPSFREVRQYVGRNCMRELKQATWPLELDRIDGKPDCKHCPQRTGNDKENYPGARADVCTNPPCFEKKAEAWATLQLEAAHREGKEVLSAEECKELFKYGDHVAGNKYVALCEHVWQDKTHRTWGELVGKALKDQVVVATNRSGSVVELLPRAAAEKKLHELHGLLGSNGAGGGNSYARDQAAERKRAERRKRAALLALGDAEACVRARASAVTGWTPGVVKTLQALVVELARQSWADACALVARRRGGADRLAAAAYFSKLAGEIQNGPELLALLAEILCAKNALTWACNYSTGPSDESKKWFKLLGADLQDCFKRADQEAAKKAPRKTLPLAAAAQQGKAGKRAGTARKAARGQGRRLPAASPATTKAKG